MRERRGLPIAGYLGVLTALALAAAFVAMLAIVIWLPPRPPDVMRADTVADHFRSGYDHMVATGRPFNERGMVWQVREDEPRDTDPTLRMAQHELADSLALESDQVRIAASHIAGSETFVFRVRDIESAVDANEIIVEMQQARDEAEARAEEARERVLELEEQRREAAEQAADDRERLSWERAYERERRRAEAIAERQAAAADRLARRIEQRVRIEDGRVIITDGEGSVIVEAPEVGEDVTMAFEAATPPAPPEAPRIAAPPAPPTARTPAATPAPAPVAPVPHFAPAPAGVLLISGFEVGAELPDGRWLVMRQGRNWAELGWIARAALIIGGTLSLLSLLAVLFARRLTRPIRNFAEAVQAVGVDPQNEPVREEGPRELRGAARAVNSMQARLRALIADRTKTLAAVAHDMRTPLMRLRLAAEKAPPEQRDRMAKEIEEVEALVASFIAFARDDPAEEARVRLDLAALLQSIADDHASAGRDVRFQGEERLIVTGQSLGLKRLFSNLVDNSLKYGSRAQIALRREDGAVVVDVEDDGPGIPADRREAVFEPFVRLNEEGTRGAGLGLAAARSIARAHGGDIVILDAENGALVRVTLPN